MKKTVLIMAGGSGTRFWPLSTDENPKQFLDLVSDKPMILETFDRISKLVPPEQIYIVTTEKYLEKVKNIINNIKEENIILEPSARDTAAAIALASIYIQKRNENSLMLVLPSDHLISKEEEFLSKINLAFEEAKNDVIITMGIVPEYPETGYGYIEYDERDKGKEICGVVGFREKPNRETAEQYISRGNYLWNSGMFLWKTDYIINEIYNFMPDHKKIFSDLEKDISNYNGIELSHKIEELFVKLPKISIDFGVMEKTKQVKVLPADIGWNDIGSFLALEKVFKKDNNGNIIKSNNNIYIDSEDNIVINKENNKMISLIGIEDLIVVNTKDAILLCNKKDNQNIKSIVDKLRDINDLDNRS